MHDLQEADLPETQRGLVISEIAQFRERAAKKERERAKENGIGPVTPTASGMGMGMGPASGPRGAPSGPKMREWGKPQHGQSPNATDQQRGGFGKGPQGYDKPVNFVRGEENGKPAAPVAKTDEELEQDRKEARRREEENSFRDVRTLPSGSASVWHHADLLFFLFAYSANEDMNLENVIASKLLSVPWHESGRRRKLRIGIVLR